MRPIHLLLAGALGAALFGCDAASSGDTSTCSPGATESCDCGSQREGERTCSPDGGAWTTCECVPCGDVSLTATGVIHTSVASITLELAPASAFLEFAGAQGTCLGHALVSVGDASGCALDVEYGSADGAFGGVRSIVLSVGPACPGFSAEQEGLYASGAGWGAGWWSGPSTRAASLSCAMEKTLTFPEAVVQLLREDGAALFVDLGGLTLHGDLPMQGSDSPFISCVEDACAPGMHDGGGGWCAPEGGCGLGYHDGGAGACVLWTGCSHGYGLVADGSCQAWEGTGSMLLARNGHAAFRLPSGDVLVTGGYAGYSPSDPMTSEIYDASSGVWRSAAAPLQKHEEGAYAQLLDGRVLAVGGFDAWAAPDAGGNLAGGTTVAEIYSPPAYDGDVGSWSPAAEMTTRRYHHTATLLKDGRVLVTGGETVYGAALASAEIFDPSTGKWTATGSMTVARVQHAAALLADGRLLVVGGLYSGGSAELFDPATGTFSTTDAPWDVYAYPAATSLEDGRVLVFGGGSFVVEVFDPSSNAFEQLASLPYLYGLKAVQLLNGEALLVGSGGSVLINLVARTTLALPSPGGGGYGASATLLGDGTVLVAGGSGATAELYVGAR